MRPKTPFGLQSMPQTKELPPCQPLLKFSSRSADIHITYVILLRVHGVIVPLNSGGYRLGHSSVLAFLSVSEVLIVSGAVSLVMLSLQKTDTHWGELSAPAPILFDVCNLLSKHRC